MLTSYWLWSSKRKLWNQRNIQQYIYALFSTLVVLLVLGLLNFTAIRYNIRWDFTENQIHTLSSQSQALIAQLTQPLELLNRP